MIIICQLLAIAYGMHLIKKWIGEAAKPAVAAQEVAQPAAAVSAAKLGAR